MTWRSNLRITGIIAKWLFILCLPILLLTISIAGAVNSLWLYQNGFEEYNVGQTTGLAEEELEKAARGLIGYFNSGEEYITLTVVKDGAPFELFNQREVIHLKDVKGLIRLDYRLLLGTLIYVLAYAGLSLLWQRKRHWRRLAWGLVGGGSITLALMLALGVGMLFNFDQLFWQFHLISFANEFWLLDPTTDYLIMLFPEGFWFDAVLFCAGVTIGLAVVLGGAGGAYLLRTKRKTSQKML
jgi:integral membrane protein (TIGR01906 family)